MRCIDRGQAEERVKDAQASTLSGLGTLVNRADSLDGAAAWLHEDDVEMTRQAVSRLRDAIAMLRVAESCLAAASESRRRREVAARKESQSLIELVTE